MPSSYIFCSTAVDTLKLIVNKLFKESFYFTFMKNWKGCQKY